MSIHCYDVKDAGVPARGTPLLWIKIAISAQNSEIVRERAQRTRCKRGSGHWLAAERLDLPWLRANDSKFDCLCVTDLRDLPTAAEVSTGGSLHMGFTNPAGLRQLMAGCHSAQTRPHQQPVAPAAAAAPAAARPPEAVAATDTRRSKRQPGRP